MTRLRATLLPLAILLGACSINTGPDMVSNEAGFSVRASSGALVLRNESAARVHYVAVEQETAALVDLNPDFTQWPGVAPGEEKTVPFAEINGYDRSARKIVVHWATAEPRAMGHLVVSVE